MTTAIIGRRTRKNNNNVYVLGAGFSADAGLPTIPDFLNHMRDASDWLALNHRDDERAAVERVLEFRHSAAAAGYRINVDLDNIEDLFSLAAALPDQGLRRDMQAAIGATLNYSQTRASAREVRLRLRAKGSWPVTKEWRERVFRISAAGDSHDVFCSVYDYYAALLAGRASSIDAGQNVVLTFNYDLLLENSLEALGIPYSYGLGTNGVAYDAASRSVHDAGSDTLAILKLHGSLNWLLSESGNGQLHVFRSYDDVARQGIPYVVPPTWDKGVSTPMRHIWSQAVEALRQATRVVVVGFSFRVVDAHFKYLLAAGLMDNSALRKIVVINPHATKLARQIRSVVRRDQFAYGAVELYNKKLHEFASAPDDLEQIGRGLRHEALSILDMDRVRLMASESGMVIDPAYVAGRAR